jgi:hypothetical protein
MSPFLPQRRFSLVKRTTGEVRLPFEEIHAEIGSVCYAEESMDRRRRRPTIDTCTNSASASGSLRTTDYSGSLRSYTSAIDAIALKVGRSAHHYLQECFYTEVSVLNRDRFDAVPEIVKSDLTIMVSQNPTSNSHYASMHSRLKSYFVALSSAASWKGKLQRRLRSCLHRG